MVSFSLPPNQPTFLELIRAYHIDHRENISYDHQGEATGRMIFCSVEAVRFAQASIPIVR